MNDIQIKSDALFVDENLPDQGIFLSCYEAGYD